MPMRRINALPNCMAIQGRIGVVLRSKSSTIAILAWGSGVILYVALWPTATVATSIVTSTVYRRALLSLVTCEVRVS